MKETQIKHIGDYTVEISQQEEEGKSPRTLDLFGIIYSNNKDYPADNCTVDHLILELGMANDKISTMQQIEREILRYGSYYKKIYIHKSKPKFSFSYSDKYKFFGYYIISKHMLPSVNNPEEHIKAELSKYENYLNGEVFSYKIFDKEDTIVAMGADIFSEEDAAESAEKMITNINFEEDEPLY